MPNPDLTFEVVADVADRILQEGLEPSSTSVQKRIGSGSYSTVVKYLKIWRQRRAEQTRAVEIPAELAEEGMEFIRAVWRSAQSRAEREIQAAKEQAAAQVAEAQQELQNALEEMQRLERVEAEQSQLLAQQTEQIRQLEVRSATLAVEAERVPAITEELQRVRAQLGEAQAEGQRWRAQAEAQPSVATALAELRAQVEALRPPEKRRS